MFGTALYYPHIDISDASLLRGAALFWDDIQTIVPTGIENPYLNRDTRVLADQGLLSPLLCDLHGDLLNDLGRRVMAFLQRPPSWAPAEPYYGPGASDSALQDADMLGNVLRERLDRARLHPGKMSPELRALFANVEGDEANFLLVDGYFADFYMAILAARLAQETEASPISGDRGAFGVNLRSLIDEVATTRPTRAHGALLTVVLESLNVDPSVPIEKLVKFRRRNERQLAELSQEFSNFTAEIEKAETGREVEDKAARVYRERVRPGLERLKEELSDQSIGAAWQGFKQTALVSTSAGSLLGTFSHWPAGALLGAGGFLTLADVALQAHLSGRKVRRTSPYTYLLDARSRFSVPHQLVN